MAAERDLLFAVLAYENELIDLGQFASVCRAWAEDNSIPLADRLVEIAWLTNEDRTFVEKAVERKFAKHQNDSRVTSNSFLSGNACNTIDQIEDVKIPQPMSSLLTIGQFVTEDCVSTHIYTPQSELSDLFQPAGRPRDRYELIEEVGKGGLGRVWLAKDDIMAREVVLKEIKPGKSAASQEAVRRLLKEAQITGQLQHPNIVPVYDMHHGGEPFYTMKLVKGETLSEAIQKHHEQRFTGREARLSLRRLLDIFVNVCEALAYALTRHHSP